MLYSYVTVDEGFPPDGVASSRNNGAQLPHHMRDALHTRRFDNPNTRVKERPLMAHHDDQSVNWLWRGLKTSTAEPAASKLGEKLGAYFLGHPSIVKLLDGVSADWRSLLATGIKAGGGVAEIPGKGPVIYILNEALDAFVVGLGRSLQDLKDKSPEDIANNLEVMAATNLAAKAIQEAKVKVDLLENAFHAEKCLKAKGKPVALLEAVGQGAVPKNCACTGEVLNGFKEALDAQSQATAEQETDPLTVIELIERLMNDADENDDEVLRGQVAHFRAEFTSLSEGLRLKFEFLAKESRAKEKLKLLIGYADEKWEAVIDAMLDDPIGARAEGVIKTLAGGFGKIGEKIAAKASAESGEADRLLTSIGSALRRDVAARNLRYAESLKARHFNKKFRKHQDEKRGWFTYLTYGTIITFITIVVWYGVTH